MSDPREMLAILVPGAVNLDGTGGRSDARQQLAAALARVRPPWAGDLLLALYTDDLGALKRVNFELMQELAGMVWPEKHPPGTLRRVAAAVLSEYTDPPPCLSCNGTAHAWSLVEGAVASVDCPACNGRGRRRLTPEELAVTVDHWDTWAPRYARLHRLLRAHERAALLAVREAMA